MHMHFCQHHTYLLYTGIEVETPDGLFISRGMLLITTVDLPARAMLCNMKQFSGAHACSTCEDPGDNTLGKTPLHRVWPFTAACKIRTPESVVNAFRSATNTGKAVSTYLTNVAQLFFPARWNRVYPIKSIVPPCCYIPWCYIFLTDLMGCNGFSCHSRMLLK